MNRGRLSLDPAQPLWPLVVIPLMLLAGAWLTELIGGLL